MNSNKINIRKILIICNHHQPQFMLHRRFVDYDLMMCVVAIIVLRGIFVDNHREIVGIFPELQADRQVLSIAYLLQSAFVSSPSVKNGWFDPPAAPELTS